MDNKKVFRLICLIVLVVSATVDFILMVSVMFAAAVTMMFFVSSMDMTDDYTRMVNNPQGMPDDETIWKMFSVFMIFVLVLIWIHGFLMALFK